MRHAATHFRFVWVRVALAIGLCAFGAVAGASAQQAAPGRRIVVTGEGQVSVAPDIAQIRSGVVTRGKTVQSAAETNAKAMAAILAALTESGIAPKDVQTTQLSIQPEFSQPKPGEERRLVGYSVGNHVTVKIRQVDRLGGVLDRMIAAGATDVWNLEFLVSNPNEALLQARAAAIADARQKAETYARAAGVTVGRVYSIEEEPVASLPVRSRALAQAAAQLPIAPGENTLSASVTVGFEIAD